MKRILTLGALVALFCAGAACGSDDDNGNASDTTEAKADTTLATTADGPKVDATLKEFTIAVSPASTTAGDVHFALHNEGSAEHEFVVFKTDLDPANLPVDKDGNVDEEGAGVKHIGEQEDIKPGSTPSLSLSLDAGNYVVICNLPGHYKAGMHTTLKVS